MPATHPHRWTVEEMLALPDDGNRYEVIDGELLVSPSPAAVHQYCVLELYRILHAYVDVRGIGVSIISPSDVRMPFESSVQPDVFVMPLVNGKRPRSLLGRTPLLVVEVLSPSTARVDRGRKRTLYQSSGVPYWIVDHDARRFERWMPTADRVELLNESISWQPDPAHEPLVIDIPRFFDDLNVEP